MAYKQLRDANMATGYTGGWCLKFVQDSFGTDHPYATAMDSWNTNYGNGNHPNELPPVGKTVPVYFALGTEPAGHVAISLDDGKIASSTQSGYHSSPYFHSNLQNMIDVYAKYNGGCSYLGWKEYVGTVRVVENVTTSQTTNQGGADMPIPNADNYHWRYNKAMVNIRGRELSRDEFNKNFVGRSDLAMLEAMLDNAEADANVNHAKVGKQAIAENWQKQIADTKKQLADEIAKDVGLTKNLADQNIKIDELNKQITSLQATS